MANRDKPSVPEQPLGGCDIELTRDLELSERQTQLLEMHSVYNALNALVFQIEALGHLAGETGSADRLMDEILAWHAGLENRAKTLAHLRLVPQMRARLGSWLDEIAAGLVPELETAFAGQRENLLSICDVLAVRAEELLRREVEVTRLEVRSLEEIRFSLLAALKAMQKNSFGRWRVTFAPGDRERDCYLVEIELSSLDGHSLRMPGLLEDVLRDLTANARKYTEPGGWIRVTLAEEADRIRLQVEDNGRGISAEALEKVVEFGERGDIKDVRRRIGGGFGLTKAYESARMLGGRMWIRSEVSKGTRVTIEIPRPGSSALA